MSLDSKLVSN